MSVNTIPEVSHDETNTSVTRIGCNIVRTQFIHKALQLAQLWTWLQPRVNTTVMPDVGKRF